MKEIVFDLLCVGRPAKIFLSHGPEVNIQLYLITKSSAFILNLMILVMLFNNFFTNFCKSEDEHWFESFPGDS